MPAKSVKGRRMSLGTAAVLHALARGFSYGFDVMQQTGLTSGAIYPALEKLELAGLVRSSWERAQEAHAEKRPARRYYEITADGREALVGLMERYRCLAPLAADTRSGR